MISLADCIGLCGLDPAEVAAIADHEHLSEIAAAVLGQYLLAHAQGPEKIRGMLIDDIRAAVSAGDHRHAAGLASALHHFVISHPCGKAVFTGRNQA